MAEIRVEPMDAFNRALVEAVHPPDWVNPAPADDYHLVVLGAGTGGLVSAAIAASLGARVALVERHLMGGDCLNVGCVPSKAVLRSARSWDSARNSAERFGGPPAAGPGDFAAVMERMRRIRARIAPIDGAERFRRMGVDVFLGEGRFTSPRTLEVEGKVLRFRRAIIATGARPASIPVPGLEGAGVLTNETVFSLEEVPPRFLVVGGGPIGCELAQAFQRLGSRVTLVHADRRLLPREDAEAAAILEAALTGEGVRVLHEARILGAEQVEGAWFLEARVGDRRLRLEGDAILVAAGRHPNVEGLGLEAAGVEFTPHGIRVDDHLRTSARGIYAVGDVATDQHFTHLADHMARIAVQNALFRGRKRFSRLVVPRVTYTSPEVAQVGHTAETAREAGQEVDTVRVELAEVDRALLDGEAAGFLKVHLRRGSDRIVGGTLVAEHAGEIIGTLTLAVTQGVGFGRLGEMIQPYPTQADVLMKAANQWRRRKLTPMARRVLSLLLRMVR